MREKEAQQPWDRSGERRYDDTINTSDALSAHITALICCKGEKGFRSRHWWIYLLLCQAAFGHTPLIHRLTYTFMSTHAHTHTFSPNTTGSAVLQ